MIQAKRKIGGVCDPHLWMMLPVARCASKHEAVRVESELIRLWRPSLNQGDRPFWMMQERYVTEFKLRTRSRRPHPRKTAPNVPRTSRHERDPLTTYQLHLDTETDCTAEGPACFDLGGILRTAADRQNHQQQQPRGRLRILLPHPLRAPRGRTPREGKRERRRRRPLLRIRRVMRVVL